MQARTGWRWLEWVTIATILCLAASPASESLAQAPTPISACGTISTPGNYMLTADLQTGGHCFVIAASSVGIDLNNHTISGAGTSGSSAITDGGVDEGPLVIVNGKIKGFYDGILLYGSSHVTIDKVDSSGNLEDGIYIVGGLNTVTNTTVSNNGGDGLRVRGATNLISKVTATGNKTDGILSEGGSTLVTDCTATSNGSGIEADGGSNFLTNLKVMRNGSGIDAFGGSNSLINSVVTHNSGHGFSSADDHNVVDGSNVSDNGNVGILLPGSNNLVNASVANGNGGDGISLGYGAAGGNLVTGSTANSNSGGSGIVLVGTGSLNIVSRSEANNNGSGGVGIACPGNVFKVTAHNNSGPNLSISNGSCAEAGVVGAPSPTALSACSATPLKAGSYVVTRNLSAAGNCFTIGGSPIAIDLGHHTITGNGTGSAITDGGTAFQSIIIADGKIENFASGINLPASSTVTVDSVNASSEINEGIFIGGSGNTVTSVEANDTRGVGMGIASCCNTIAGAVANGNSGSGIDVEGAFDLLTHVSVNQNGHDGLDCKGNCFVTAVKAKNDRFSGLFLPNPVNSVTDSLIADNAGGSIALGPSSAVNHSEVKGNGGAAGIYSWYGIVVNATVSNQNTGDGMDFGVITGDSLVAASGAAHNQGDGIAGNGEDSIARSVADSNGKTGVTLPCPGNVYSLVADHNPSGNLSESGSGCVNLLNNAP